MPEPPNAVAMSTSVAYLRIPRYEGLAVSEQVAHKERLFARARDGLADVEPNDRVVLDADDGLAIVLYGEPSRALTVSQRIHALDAFEPVQLGLNFGPLALSSAGRDARVLGDGLAAAAAAARFAEPDRLLITEDFARALRHSAPERAADLAKAGEFTDARVRQHVLYTPDPRRSVMRRRRFALYAVGGVAAILLLGVIGRDIYQPLFRSRPGIVTLEIQPRGDVYVDGIFHGRSPPLTEVQLLPGPHRMQVRSAGASPYNVMLNVTPGQHISISHTFVRNPEPRPKPDFWRDLKKKFGS